MSTIKTAHGCVHISDGNRKMGETPSFSVPAVITCRKNAPCFRDCYATQGTFAFDSVQRGYWENKLMLDRYTSETRKALQDYILTKKVPFFRFNVSGDIYSLKYLELVESVSALCEDTQFLVFTKQYELINDYLTKYGNYLPDNLHIMFSKWEGLDIPNPYNFPTAHVIFQDGHTTAHEGYHLCPGKCSTCQNAAMGCWAAGKGEEVAFHIHGSRLKYSPEAQESSFRKFCEKQNAMAKEWGLV